jgi:hypothetical protein
MMEKINNADELAAARALLADLTQQHLRLQGRWRWQVSKPADDLKVDIDRLTALIAAYEHPPVPEAEAEAVPEAEVEAEPDAFEPEPEPDDPEPVVEEKAKKTIVRKSKA